MLQIHDELKIDFKMSWGCRTYLVQGFPCFLNLLLQNTDIDLLCVMFYLIIFIAFQRPQTMAHLIY